MLNTDFFSSSGSRTPVDLAPERQISDGSGSGTPGRSGYLPQTARWRDALRTKTTQISTKISQSTDHILTYWLGPHADPLPSSREYGIEDETSSTINGLRNMPTIVRLLADTGKFNVREMEDPMHGNDVQEHIRTLSLICITAIALLVAIVYLRDVLVPLLLAFFFMCLLEPVLFFLLNPFSLVPGFSKRAMRIDSSRVQALSGRPVADTCANGVTAWRIHAGFALVLCLIFVLSIIALVVYLIWKSLEGFSLKKYSNSVRLRDLLRQIKKFHGEVEELKEVDEELDWGALLKWLLDGAILQDLFKVTMTFLGIVFLTVLFLAFLLISDLSASRYDAKGLRQKARLSVTRYVRIKTLVSLGAALLIWFVLALIKVDLAFLFAFLTFVLNYIPHIGYAIAVLLPLPFAYFDPSKTMTDFVLTIVLPVLIHVFFSFLIEPRLLGDSLDLHSLVVLVSFIFWTVCWGAVGAILSVPLTSVFRLICIEIDHPYAVAVVRLLEGRWGAASTKKNALGGVKVRRTARVLEFWMSAVSPSGSPFKEIPRMTELLDSSAEVLDKDDSFVSEDSNGGKLKNA